MPIRPSLRWLYPIDWPQLSRVIRFGRARGRCELCARPHGAKVLCVPGGRWFDQDTNRWRDGRGRLCEAPWGADLDQLVPPASSWRPPIWTTIRPTTLSPT